MPLLLAHRHMHCLHLYAWLQVKIISCGLSWGFRSRQKCCFSVSASHQSLLRPVSVKQSVKWVRHGFQHKQPRRCKFVQAPMCLQYIPRRFAMHIGMPLVQWYLTQSQHGGDCNPGNAQNWVFFLFSKHGVLVFCLSWQTICAHAIVTKLVMLPLYIIQFCWFSLIHGMNLVPAFDLSLAQLNSISGMFALAVMAAHYYANYVLSS